MHGSQVIDYISVMNIPVEFRGFGQRKIVVGTIVVSLWDLPNNLLYMVQFHRSDKIQFTEILMLRYDIQNWLY